MTTKGKSRRKLAGVLVTAAALAADALALLLELGAVDPGGRLLPPDEAPPGLAP